MSQFAVHIIPGHWVNIITVFVLYSSLYGEYVARATPGLFQTQNQPVPSQVPIYTPG